LELLPLVKAIPATFWGVLAGSLFTLLGVLLSNAGQDRRLQRQLEHDREMKQHERELALRREVYLPAVAAVQAGLEMLGNIGNSSVPLEKLSEGWSTASPSIARAMLIANETTLASMARFHAAMGSKALGLMAIRIRLDAEKTEMDSWMHEVQQLQEANAEHLSRWEQRFEGGKYDPAHYQRESSQFHERSSRVKELLAQYGEENRTHFDKRMRFMEQVVEGTVEIGGLLTPVIRSVREELGLPFDAFVYAQIVEEAQAKSKQDIEAYANALREIADDHVGPVAR
jgi:hypothetical protein